MLTKSDKKYIQKLKSKKREPDYSCWKEWDKTLSWEEFLKYIKPYKHIRVGVDCEKSFNGKIFLRVTKKQIAELVKADKMDVTFTVMVNPNIKDDIGTMFISKMRITLLDKK